MSIEISLANGSGSVSVSADNFGVDYNEALIHQIVNAYMASGRAATSQQKNRAAVSGGGKKPWRQKGTGRARAGTIRSPIFVGGGRAFPSGGVNFKQKVNRKMYRGAMRSIWSELARQNRLLVVESIDVEGKTKQMADFLGGINAGKALIVVDKEDENVFLAARNLPNTMVVLAGEVDPVSLVGFENVVITAGALASIDEALS